MKLTPEEVKLKIVDLWKSGLHNKAEIARQVKRSRAYVWQVLLKARVIRRKRK
jgi:hypothetical protein